MAGLKANQASVLGLAPGDKDLVTVTTPDGANFRVARKVAPQFSAFLTDLHGTGYKLNPKQSGGYNYRTIGGSPRLSQHAYGNAIDLNWGQMPMGSAKHNLPANVGDIAAKHGLAWGGTWKNPDPMHFEASTLTPGSPAAAYGAQNAATEVASNGAPMAQPIGGAPIQGGPVPLTPPSPRNSRLAELFLERSANAQPDGWGTLIQALGNQVTGQGYAQKHDEETKAYQGKLAQMLGASASDPNQLAATLLSSGDPQLVQQGVALKVSQAKKPEQLDIERRAVAGGLQPGTPEYRDFVLKGGKGQTGEEYGTTPVPYTDKDGVLRYAQVSKAGGRKDLELPEGAKWAPGSDIKDLGTSLVPFNKKTGEAGAPIAKDITGREAAEAVGKQAGAAQASLPSMKTTMDDAFRTIEELRKHPGRETGTGLSGKLDPRNYFAGSDATDFAITNRKAKAKSFMAAREGLKGAGQVTDFEGGKGEDAIAALDTAQSDEQYLKALDDLERMMQASYDDLKAKAGMAGGAPAVAPPAAAQPAPAARAQPSKPPVRIMSKQGYDALPSGTQYVAPDGQIRVKQ